MSCNVYIVSKWLVALHLECRFVAGSALRKYLFKVQDFLALVVLYYFVSVFLCYALKVLEGMCWWRSTWNGGTAEVALHVYMDSGSIYIRFKYLVMLSLFMYCCFVYMDVCLVTSWICIYH